MRNRLLILLVILIFIGMLIVSYDVKKLNVGELLLIMPKVAEGRGIDREALYDVTAAEKNTSGKLLLTYEITSTENVKASNANYSVTLVKTNYTYPYVMGTQVLSGSFFTENDEKSKSKTAVLNQVAAYSLFGSLDIKGVEIYIGGDRFTVVGVIQTADENSSYVFVPASCYQNNPDSIVVWLNETTGISEEYVINECKSLSVQETRYDFINLSFISGIIRSGPRTGLKFAAICLIVSGIYWLGQRLIYNLRELRKLSESFYFRELLTGSVKSDLSDYAGKSAVMPAVIPPAMPSAVPAAVPAATLAATLSAIVLMAITFCVLFPSLVRDLLILKDSMGFIRTGYVSFYSSDSLTAMGTVVYSMQKYMLMSLVLLVLFGICIVLFTVFQITSQTPLGQPAQLDRLPGER